MPFLANIEDHRQLAQRRLPRWLFDYIDGGSHDEHTLRANVQDLRALRVRQRVMRDVSRIDSETTLFGQRLALPLLLGPVGLAGLYARRGEVQAARAARAAGLPFCLSSVSICAIDEVAQGCGTPPWFQLYMIRDRGYMRTLLQQAQAQGCPVLVFTVDLPVPAPRYRDVHSGFATPPTARRFLKLAWDSARHPGWAWDVMARGKPHAFGNFAAGVPEARALNNFGGWVAKNYEPGLTWQDIAWVREHWAGPIVVKGVLDADDAASAVDAGVDGLIVSNHGGRQLDGTSASISALPAIAARVQRRVPVLMDGGIRSGLDLLKALALGADACLIGRAWAYGLASGGERGVAHVLEILARELRTAMALSGCTSLAQIDRSVLLD